MSETLPSMDELLERAYQKGREDAIEEYESADIPIIHGKDELEGYRKKVRADAIEEYTKKLRKRIEGNKIIAEGLANNDKFKELAFTNLDLEEIEMIAEDMKEGKHDKD